MEEFFNTIYYWTNSLYCEELDNYLYETVPGYLHVGLSMLVISSIVCCLFYYIAKPVRNQMKIWLLFVLLNAALNMGIAIWYTMTPLINNEIDEAVSWFYFDCVGFGISNIIWSFVAFIAVSFIIKWWSPAKFVPFQKF